MWRSRQLTDSECELLRKNPNVKQATPKRFSLQYEFRVKLYEYWESHSRTTQDIRDFMSANGFDVSAFTGTTIIKHLNEHMKQNGYPSNGKNTVPGQIENFRPSEEDNAYLISTGKFTKSRSGKGISFSKPFEEELYGSYPEQTIKEGLKKAGIDPEKVGYQRIYALKRRFDGYSLPKEKKRIHSEEEIRKYSGHPYIERITEKQLVLKQAFYHDAGYLKDFFHINDILRLFEIEPELLTISQRNRIRYKLNHTDTVEEAHICEVAEQNLRILRNITKAMDAAADKALTELRAVVPELTKEEKKRLCQLIDPLTPDPGKKYTKRYILKSLGISKSSYYSCLNSSEYGMKETVRELQDEEDIEVIRKVIDYMGYPKGTRMIYMMMKDITGKQFSINKIRRLKRKYGIVCPVRQPSVNRKEMRELMERNRKDNLLKRTFRMHRPNEVYLSDVTYLKYGKEQTAYGSAVKDAVTGRLLAFVISEHNDLVLAENTLKWLEAYPKNGNTLFHTDQGSLYMSDEFQKKLRSMDISQSMSKRGNCWDNASQESFFGHFKDEVDYSNCRNEYEIDRMVYEYMQYYNLERKQWTRNRMTPAEYEKYLNEMSDTEYEEYLKKESEKYKVMKKKAEKKARERYKTLGI